jgi:hypothetical protein
MSSILTARVSPWQAIVPLFFRRARYLDLAVSHALALCLESPQYREPHARGEFPGPAWEPDTRKNLTPAASKLVRSLGASLFATITFAAAALLLALLLGRVGMGRPLDIAKTLSFVGAFLAGWATLFELGGYVETFSNEQLHELLHPVLFRVLFLPGLAVAALGQVW